MTEPTLSTRIRAILDELKAINNELTVLLDDATKIGLVPYRRASIDSAIIDTEHAQQELNQVATALELTDLPLRP